MSPQPIRTGCWVPSLATTGRAEKPKPLAVVLATSTSEGTRRQAPVLTYQPVGSGRAVVVEGAGMWRWAFLPPDHKQHDATYATLWRSLIRWLVANVGLLPSQQLALRTDEVTFSTTELVVDKDVPGSIRFVLNGVADDSQNRAGQAQRDLEEALERDPRLEDVTIQPQGGDEHSRRFVLTVIPTGNPRAPAAAEEPEGGK